jgi:hypothetical protein
MDIRVNKEFVKVQHGVLGVVLSGYYETARVETEQTVEHATGLDGISTAGLDPLPDPGEPVEEIMYEYNGSVVLCGQAHTRTTFTPEETPALFTFVRSGTDLDWIPNEKVEIGETRWYEGTEYEALQAHMTQDDWTPPQTTGTLWTVVSITNEWQVGVNYSIGDQVTYEGTTYECLQAHTSQVGWEPPNATSLWSTI